MWSFCHPGGNGMQQASSDAEGAFGGRTESSAPTFKNDSAMQNCRSGPMSTRKGQAASVTLLRREQLRSASAPTKSIVDSPTSIRRKSRARLWSIEGVRGKHPKVFPGLFSFARRFLFGEAKRKCRPFPLFWKKQTKKRMWTPNRLGISKNSARWRKNTEKARKIPNHFKNIPCFFRQRVV